MSKIIRPVITWAIVAVACYFGWKFLGPLFAPESQETNIQTTVVRRGDLRKSVPADGVVEPYNQVEVKSKASGVVEEIFIETGDTVEAGQVLFELDKEEILARKRQAEADVAAAEAQLVLQKRNLSPQQRASRESSIRQAEISRDNAKTSYERIADLFSKGFATQQELDDAKRSLDQAEETLKQAQDQYELDLQGGEPEQIDIAQATLLRRRAELDNVNEELANTTIKAPMSGTVLTRPVEIGTAVASGTSGNTGGTITCTIGDLSRLKVVARIEETDLGQVRVDAPCRVTFDSYQGWVWSGKLTKIEPQGEVGGNNQGTQFPVEIDLDLANPSRESGMQAGGSFMTGGMGGMRAGGGVRSGGGMGAPRPGAGRRPSGSSPADSQPAEEEAGAAEEKPKQEPPRLYPNLTASVEIVLEDHPDVLILSAQFIQYDSGKPYVEVAADPQATDERERKDIELGFSDGLRFEIVRGVEEGDTVVLEKVVTTQG